MFFRRVARLTWLFSLLRGTKWASQIRVGKIVFPTSRAFWNDSMGIMVPDGLGISRAALLQGGHCLLGKAQYLNSETLENLMFANANL